MKNRSNTELFEKAKTYAFLLLKFRPRSEHELAGRLKQKKFPPEIITGVIDFLKEKKFVDDAAFTRGWVEGRIKQTVGLRRVKNELKLKGISSPLVEDSIAAAAENYSEDAVVADIIGKKLEKLQGKDPAKTRQRIYAYLVRRGFSPEVAFDNLKRMIKDES